MDVKTKLDLLVTRYNNESFIEADPISVPHKFSKKEDIEISAFLASVIAWGNRKIIVKNANRIMELFDNAPYDFIMNFDEKDFGKITNFVHRTFNSDDLQTFVKALQRLCKKNVSLGNYFENAWQCSSDMRKILSKFRADFFDFEHLDRSERHLSAIDKNSACKRLNMFLRWMIRHDEHNVDFGLWKKIPMSALYLPLDVHSGNSARKLGLLTRKQNDWKAVEEITQKLKVFDSEDPVKYDFALFGVGINAETLDF